MSTSDLADSVFLRACRREPVPYTPVWLMRQAGRYQASYRAVRSKVGFLEMCKSPELASQVTIAAVEELGVDAAIIFADILLLLEPMGVPIVFTAGDGPQITKTVRTTADIDALVAEIDAKASLGYVLEAIKRVRAALPKTPMIGFAASPFTLASYAIEGGGSKNYTITKTMMYADPGAFSALLAKISEATIRYLLAQVDAGAHAVQLFDSWVGALGPADFRAHVLPHLERIVAAMPRGVPVIMFGTGTSGYLTDLAATGASVVGVDWRIDLATASAQLPGVAIQGNLDPSLLYAPRAKLVDSAHQLVDKIGQRPGWIFNLGHGIMPETPEDNVRALVDAVHERSAR